MKKLLSMIIFLVSLNMGASINAQLFDGSAHDEEMQELYAQSHKSVDNIRDLTKRTLFNGAQLFIYSFKFFNPDWERKQHIKRALKEDLDAYRYWFNRILIKKK